MLITIDINQCSSGDCVGALDMSGAKRAAWCLDVSEEDMVTIPVVFEVPFPSQVTRFKCIPSI